MFACNVGVSPPDIYDCNVLQIIVNLHMVIASAGVYISRGIFLLLSLGYFFFLAVIVFVLNICT